MPACLCGCMGVHAPAIATWQSGGGRVNPPPPSHTHTHRICPFLPPPLQFTHPPCSNNWSFSTTRLNWHVAEMAARQGGCMIVDATRKGKRFPVSPPPPGNDTLAASMHAHCGASCGAAWKPLHACTIVCAAACACPLLPLPHPVPSMPSIHMWTGRVHQNNTHLGSSAEPGSGARARA